MKAEAPWGPARAPGVEQLVERFLLGGRESAARRYPPSLRGRVRELVAAGRDRARAADLLLEHNPPSALTLYREAALLYIAAFVTVSSGDAVAEPFRADELLSRFSPPGGASPPCDGRGYERFLARLRDGDLLGADRTEPAVLGDRGEVARVVVTWLGQLVEPRSVEEIRFARAVRVGGLAVAVSVFVVVLAALLSPENVALHKAVSVSGTNPAAPAPPGDLTDGVASRSGGVRTTASDAPWVQVDLGAIYELDTVKIYGAARTKTEEGLPLTLQLSQDGRTFTDVATRAAPCGTWFPWTAKAEHRPARYVRVRGARGKAVAFSEVEVFGEKKK